MNEKSEMNHALAGALFEQSKVLVTIRQHLITSGMRLKELGKDSDEIKVIAVAILESSEKIGGIAVEDVTLSIGVKAMACAEEEGAARFNVPCPN